MDDSRDFAPAPPPRVREGRTRPWLHFSLVGITLLSTMMIGAQNAGFYPEAILADPTLFLTGLPYAISILTILTFHEMGHYLAARYHGVRATWPFYIPLPIPYLFHFGTMGAFIKIRSMMPNRNALMDIAVAGPLAGLVASLAVLFIGYGQIGGLEEVVAHEERIHPWPSEGLNGLTLGSSLLFSAFNEGLGGGLIPMNEIYHFPLLFAGWTGFFVTAMNLFLIGQLDGGHVIYALTGRNSRWVSILNYGGLIALSAWLYWQHGSNGLVWTLWMVLLLVIGLGHPPTRDDSLPLSRWRAALGWLCILIFFLCFIPLPVYFID